MEVSFPLYGFHFRSLQGDTCSLVLCCFCILLWFGPNTNSLYLQIEANWREVKSYHLELLLTSNVQTWNHKSKRTKSLILADLTALAVGTKLSARLVEKSQGLVTFSSVWGTKSIPVLRNFMLEEKDKDVALGREGRAEGCIVVRSRVSGERGPSHALWEALK